MADGFVAIRVGEQEGKRRKSMNNIFYIIGVVVVVVVILGYFGLR
jgi:predicted nucleic acid-binding Zn ribbon protein